jgi:hypothetical protein
LFSNTLNLYSSYNKLFPCTFINSYIHIHIILPSFILLKWFYLWDLIILTEILYFGHMSRKMHLYLAELSNFVLIRVISWWAYSFEYSIV